MLDQADIRALLPHRYPLLLVDCVRSLVRWVSVVAVKSVTANEPCFAHVRGTAGREAYAYPSPLVLESFGQAALLLPLGQWRESDPQAGWQPLLASLAGARFAGSVFPGDVMEHRAKLTRLFQDVALLRGEVWVCDRRVMEVDEVVVARRRLGAEPRADFGAKQGESKP